MQRINYSDHVLEQMAERGATQSEVEETIRRGEQIPAKKGRIALILDKAKNCDFSRIKLAILGLDEYRYNFQFNAKWADKEFAMKQVMPIVVEENDEYIVVTVYTFYF